MKLIVATDNSWGIGNNNELLFRIPEDLRQFKRITTDSGVVIMGRKTFESIGKLLPNRINIVLSSKGINYTPTEQERGIQYLCLPDMDSVIDFLAQKDLYFKASVIGGASIYKQFLPYCTHAFVTRVTNDVFEADARFVNLDEARYWQLLNYSDTKKYVNYEYRFEEYINFKPVIHEIYAKHKGIVIPTPEFPKSYEICFKES